MRVSTKGRYALRMMVDLAAHQKDGCVSLKDVAQRQEISPKYLEQIAGMLMKAGLLKSERGAQGGYKLARAASEYTTGEILAAVEGNLAPTSCLAAETNECPRALSCQVRAFWEGLYGRITDYVSSITLEDLSSIDDEDMKEAF